MDHDGINTTVLVCTITSATRSYCKWTTRGTCRLHLCHSWSFILQRLPSNNFHSFRRFMVQCRITAFSLTLAIFNCKFNMQSPDMVLLFTLRLQVASPWLQTKRIEEARLQFFRSKVLQRVSSFSTKSVGKPRFLNQVRELHYTLLLMWPTVILFNPH